MMIYIYNCYGGTHSSSLASAIHLGLLPDDRIPSKEEILSLPYFNKLTRKDMGKIIFRGTDNEGCSVYSVGRGTSRILIPSLIDLVNLLGKECRLNEKVVFSNMSPAVPPCMTFGGMFSRWLHIDFVGVPLLTAGARQSFKMIAELVKLTKERGKSANSLVTVLDNEEDVKRIKRNMI